MLGWSMPQHAKKLHSFLPVDQISSHQGHITTLPIQVTQLPLWWRIAVTLVWQSVEVLKDPCKGDKFPDTEGTGLLCVTLLWQKSSYKKSTVSPLETRSWGPARCYLDLSASGKKDGLRDNLGRKTIVFFISWHRNEWIFIPNAKQTLNSRTINGETNIPGTITGFLCVLTVKTVPQDFKETCGLLFLFLSKQN